jgi:rod shape-determining protein MreC
MQKRKKLLIIALGVLLIFSLNLFQKQVRGFFYYFSAPIQKTLWVTGSNLSDFFEGIFRKDYFIEENRKLSLANQALLTKLAALKELEKENIVLREALQIKLAEDFELVFAAVTGKDATQDSILIDKGSADGLAEGMSVIITGQKQRILLGKISQVHKNFAKVTLIFNKSSFFDAEVLGRDAEGLIKGEGDQKMCLDFLPRDKVIEEGDAVISSALGGIYPRGLLVGLITEVQKDDVKPFQRAEVSPLFKLRELRNVFVILE